MTSNQFRIMSDIEHTLIRTKDTGVFQRVHSKYALSKDNIYYRTKLNHSPCLLKIIDEPIVNCSDVALKDNKVTEIKVNINPDTGVVKIYNNGRGITSKIHKEGSKFLGRKIHTPEMIFTQFRSGSNLNTDKDHDSGGINGVGIKLTNVHSDWLHLETVSKSKIYKQKYRMDLEKKRFIIEDPTINDYEYISYTQLDFLPHYKRFEYKLPFNKKDIEELIDIIRYRMYHLAVFLTFKKVNIYFNDTLIKVKNTQDLINTIEPEISEPYPIIKVRGDKNRFIEYSLKVRTGKFNTTSTVNGVVVLDGTHITHITRAINAKIKEISKDKEKKIDCKNYLCIVAMAWLPVTNWGSQSKDKLEIKETDLKDFTFKDTFITKIAKDIIEKTRIIDIKKTIKQKVNKKLIYDKYTAAKTLGKTNTVLFIAEGDSAMLLLKRGLAMGVSKYSIQNTGIFSLGGVPSNIAKGITEELDEEEELITIASEKFYESKVFGALVQCLKIDPDNKYKTKEELKTLNYDKIIICVDADLDGIGNIASLVLQMFYKLWPNLYKHKNFINIWNSPILRVTNKSDKVIKEFKFNQEFEDWVNAGNKIKDYRIAYIKGLAGHSDKYIKNMFEKFNNDLVNMKTGSKTKEQFEIFFGKDSTSRKEILSTEIDNLTPDEIEDINNGSQSILCDRHLHYYTKDFQIYAIRRTIPGLDNFTPVRRKSFTMFYKHNQTTPLKIYMAAGRIAYEYLYHHGDTSIQGAIIKMTQDYPGSNNIPLLIKDGQVGSRDRRGKDAGSARYIGASLNKKTVETLFPKDDFAILPKRFTDGVEVEPKYYLPTLPLPILEFQKSVSYGWCLELYPRDIISVCKIVKKLCKNEKITEKDKKIPLSNKHFTGELRFIDDNGVEKIYMKGLYERYKEGKTDILHIRELPLTVTPKKVELALIEDEDIVSDVSNHTTDQISIKVELKPNAFEKIDKKYGSIEKFLRLETRITEHINFINELGCIEHFSTAYDVLHKCFEMNKIKYKLKIDRELLLLKYKIQRENNIVRFIEVDEIEKIKKKSDKEIEDILDIDKFDRINSITLNTELSYMTDELITKLEKDKKFDYLMSIRVSDVSKLELEKRNKHINEMLDRQKELEEQLNETPFPGSTQYISDIDRNYEILK